MRGCSSSSLMIGDLLLPGVGEGLAEAAAAGVFGVVLNAGECGESALAKSDEARSDESSCRFCRLAPAGAEILFTCHGSTRLDKDKDKLCETNRMPDRSGN